MSKIKLSSEMLMKVAQHAAERGMSLEEYIEEFARLLQNKIQQEKADIEADLILTKQKYEQALKELA